MQTECQSGEGTFVECGVVLASKCGPLSLTPDPQQAAPIAAVALGTAAPLVPAVGDTVTARVLRTQQRLCSVEVLCVGDQKLKSAFLGVIRLQDVRDFAGEQVVMSDCYRPGDLVRAEVISLGTMREYGLSTNKAALGVIWARSLEGAPMEAVSWREMRCPVSEQTERRKVAQLAA